MLGSQVVLADMCEEMCLWKRFFHQRALMSLYFNCKISRSVYLDPTVLSAKAHSSVQTQGVCHHRVPLGY